MLPEVWGQSRRGEGAGKRLSKEGFAFLSEAKRMKHAKGTWYQNLYSVCSIYQGYDNAYLDSP